MSVQSLIMSVQCTVYSLSIGHLMSPLLYNSVAGLRNQVHLVGVYGQLVGFGLPV
jgi:hypothetical protein